MCLHTGQEEESKLKFNDKERTVFSPARCKMLSSGKGGSLGWDSMIGVEPGDPQERPVAAENS